MAAAWNDVPATGGLSECAALVRSAEALRTSAPELSVQLARRALLVGATDISSTTTHTGQAGEGRNLSMRAQAVLAAGLVRVSQHVSAVEPGFAALALAESGGALVLAAELRLDLAACAQEVGEPLLGGALLRPVLEATHAPPSVRAAALGRLVGCVAHVARRDDVEDALTEADRLLAADDSLHADARRMERARLAVRSAAYHRWYGDNEDAVTAARDGLTLLSRLHHELRAESDRLHARLVLELVCALLDEGQLHEAEDAARPTVDEPVRATAAESVGQVMLALATRVHLPAGEVDRGRGLLDQAAWLAERHGLDSMLADALTELSRFDEQAGHVKDALEALRAARAAEQRRMRAVARAARHLLTQVSASQGAKDVTQQAVAALLRQLAHPAGVPVAVAPSPAPRSTLSPARTSPEPRDSPPLAGGDEPADPAAVDKSTGLLNREGLVRRLRTVGNGERPVALTLVRFEPNSDNADEDRGPDTGIMVGLADKVRDIAPEDAELARSDGGELAVFLPHTTRDQAEEFAATIRETARESDWLAGSSGKDLSISTTVVHPDPPTADNDPHLYTAGMLTAARDALPPTRTPTPHTPPAPTPAPAASPTSTSASAGSRAPASASSASQAPGSGSSASRAPTSASAVSPTSTSASAGSRAPASASSASQAPGSASSASRASTSASAASRAPASAPGASQAPGSASFASPTPTSTPAAPQAPTSTPPAPNPAPPTPATPAPPAALPPPPIPPSSLPSTPDSLAETKAALSALSQQPPAPGHAPSSALSEDTPTTPLHAATPGDSTRAGRSVLNSLSIPSGSGGRRRAGGGEQPPGSKTGRPTEAAEAPRLTRAERRAQEQTGLTDPGVPAPSGWPAEPDISQALRRTPAPPARTRTEAAHTAQPEGTGSTGGAGSAEGARPGATAYSAAATHSTDISYTGETPAGEQPPATESPSAAPGPMPPSSFEETRAELARMMSALNANAHRARTKTSDTTGEGGAGTPSLSHPRPVTRQTPSLHDLADRLDMSAFRDAMTPRQSIPTPPEPDEMPEPPSTPDIPEPPRRPDIPEPPRPEPVPSAPPAPGPDTPAEPGPATSAQSRFATPAETGPLTAETPPESGLFTAEPRFATPAESESAAPGASTSAASGGFGLSADYGPTTPAEPDEAAQGAGRSGLMAAFDALTGLVPFRSAGGDSPSPEQDPSGEEVSFRTEFDGVGGLPSRKPLKSWAELESAAVVDSPADDLFGGPVDKPDPTSAKYSLGAAFGGEARERAGDQPATSATSPSTSSTTSAASASFTTSDELRAALWGANESHATFGEWSPAGGSSAAEPTQETATAASGPVGAEAGPVGAEARPSGDGREPSGASVGLDATTYDEPLGPQPRPAGPRRRGERSATTIASLLTEALAAYQSTTDDQDERPRTSERSDSFAGDPVVNPGRHRSPE